jgi:molecular chaperone GrpE
MAMNDHSPMDDTSTNDSAAQTAHASELEALRAQLTATENDLHNHKLQLAEYVNARKRLLRDMETERKYALEPLARELLTVLDNLDRALLAAKASGDVGPLAIGVAATADQFLNTLVRFGVKRIECGRGVAFDPNLHEAVLQQPNTDVEPGQVIQVLQQGFMLHDRVLRPASVIVATLE